MFSSILNKLRVSFSLVLLVTPGLVALTVLSPISASSTSSAALNSDTIDAYVEAQMNKHGLPGVALAIIQDQEIIYSKGYGQADSDRALTPQTPMYIGSVSKSFTALAIMQLAEAGKIDLDAPVRTYIPWFQIADEAASQTLTMRHFLHHASGLSEATYNHSLPDEASIEDVVRSMSDMTLTAPVGQQTMYFNLNYAVLALIVEKVSGQPYADYVQAHIFEPLGMRHSYTNPVDAQADGLAQGYGRFFGVALPRPQPHREYELGDGYLISTAEDMARFALVMSNKGEYNGARILSAQGIRAMFTPRPQQGFAYGMGWFVEDVNKIPRLQHGGANETFKTYVDLYPTKHTGIVLMINEGYLVDHYLSAEQVFGGVEKLMLGLGQPDPAEGWAVPLIGYGLLALVLALAVFQGWQVWRLGSWRRRAQTMSVAARAFDIALNFVIPTAIMSVVIWQSQQFFGYRFNLLYQARMIFQVLPDIGILMVIGIVPDYAQGIIKLGWLFSRPAQAKV